MVAIRIKVEGFDKLQHKLRDMNPQQRTEILTKGFTNVAEAIQVNAARKQIAGGGRGKGKALKALPNRLTSRGGDLRRDIHVDKGPLPWAVEVGTDLKYGAVHEFGGRVSVPRHKVKEHMRKIVFGRRVAPFTVPTHMRGPYSANYPKRPFMKPALDAVAPRISGIFIREWKKVAKL